MTENLIQDRSTCSAEHGHMISSSVKRNVAKSGCDGIRESLKLGHGWGRIRYAGETEMARRYLDDLGYASDRDTGIRLFWNQ